MDDRTEAEVWQMKATPRVKVCGLLYGCITLDMDRVRTQDSNEQSIRDSFGDSSRFLQMVHVSQPTSESLLEHGQNDLVCNCIAWGPFQCRLYTCLFNLCTVAYQLLLCR